MALKDRLENIRQIVRLEKKVVVSELSDKFGVTEETIRRDLEKLERDGLVVRTYGGAILSMGEAAEKNGFLKRAQTNVQEKRLIAEMTACMIPQNANIGCDASSTVIEALNYLSDREDLLVLTNSVKVIREMEQSKFGILSTGGQVNRQSYSMQGGIARNTIQDYHLEVVLISCKGLGLEGEVYDSHELEADVKRALIEHGHRIILLADHTKFDHIAFLRLASVDQLDVVVTDKRPSEDWMKMFAESGVEVYYPEQRK